MSESKVQADAEFSAMQNVYSALEPLDDDARARVLSYIASRLSVDVVSGAHSATNESKQIAVNESNSIDTEKKEAIKWQSLADLFHAANPNSNGLKALVAGYWLQVCQGAESFDGQSANTELNHLGYGVPNITDAIDSLKTQKPALAMQLKKNGSSRQARKLYKITASGIKAVESMIGG